MAELARGTVGDRPWGKTLAALGLRGLSGELALVADGKDYRIAFARGAVVAASSPVAGDATVRVALTANLVSSTQVGEVARRIAASPDRDDIEVIAELARLAPEQVMRLRRRVVAQRAARTFSIDRGEFVVDDRVTLPVTPGAEVDVRAVVYLGARANLSEQRLSEELARLGAWFQLKDDALDDVPYFGFVDADKGLIAALHDGADLAELEVAHRELGDRTVHSIIYSLVCCGACDVQATPRRPPPLQSRKPPSQPPPRAQSQSGSPTELKRGMERPRNTTGHRPDAPSAAPSLARTTTPPPPREPRGQQTVPPLADVDTAPPARTRTGSSSPPPLAEDDSGFIRMKPSSRQPPVAGTTDPSTASMRSRTTSDSMSMRVYREIDQQAARETEALIAEKIALINARVDHFELIGVARDAPPEAIRDAYFTLARKLHPDRLASLAIADPKRDAQRLFAQINTAFATLNDSVKRGEYLSVLNRGGEAVVRAAEAKVGEMASRVMRAEEAFRRGEMALRRDQLEQALTEFASAIELQPDEPEYQAMHAWVKFASAPDKKAVAGATRSVLTRTAEQMGKSVTARFYLGRVERMLGREREALEHFQEVLRIKPGHSEAASEARVLESRLRGKR